MSAIVVRTHSGEEVHRIDVSGKTEAQIDRIEMGMAINFDFEQYMFGVED